MIAYEDVKDAVFDEVLVWSDSSAESDFYRWAWEKISPALDTDDPVEARLQAVALAYVYAELCFYVCDQNFYEDLWDRLAEFVDEDMDLSLGFMCGKLGGEDCPDGEEEAVRILVRANHERVVTALRSIDTMTLLTAFRASYAMPQRRAIDADGDEIEEPLIETYADFCRYVDDDDFRDEDICGMSVSDYEAAYGWWESGAEMLDARTASDEG